MACVLMNCSRNTYNWLAQLESLYISRFYPPKNNHFSPIGTDFFQIPLLIQILRVKCAVS